MSRKSSLIEATTCVGSMDGPLTQYVWAGEASWSRGDQENLEEYL